MRKIAGGVPFWLRELFRAEDSRRIRAELSFSTTGLRLGEGVKTLFWWAVAVGVVAMFGSR